MENPFELILDKLNNIESLIKELKIQNQPAPIEIMNINQVADYIGVAKSTIYKYTACRMIPHSKQGKKIYFKKSELDEWITKNKVMTQEEIEIKAATYVSTRRRY
jgi:excisionase family DNA binding protein